MSALFEAMNKTATTDNGCLAYHTSLSANLDFFYLAGASRGKNIKLEFKKALAENPEIALRTLQWLRDIRGGAGERQLFRELFKEYEESPQGSLDELSKLVIKIPEVGRFDDLLWIVENCQKAKPLAVGTFILALSSVNGLAFKWTPIKGEVAKTLRKALGYKTEKDWRKFIVAGRKTVEQQMCAKEWNEIEFSKVPSVASARYQKAFGRNAQEKYAAYLESLQKGETTINAAAVYPYDIYKSCFNGNAAVANEQWKALPNYLEGSSERILPMIDVSGSMSCPAGGNSKLSCMDVAISLGWYLSERIAGEFNRTFLTFESNVRMGKVQEGLSLVDVFRSIKQAPWGGNTDIHSAFNVLLQTAKQHNVPQDNMPTMIIILSDMQFDAYGNRGLTGFESIQEQYEAAGYELPKIVFWNLNAANKSIPVTKHQSGASMVSGFSPALMKGILKGGMTPEQVMLDTIMVDRYKLN